MIGLNHTKLTRNLRFFGKVSSPVKAVGVGKCFSECTANHIWHDMCFKHAFSSILCTDILTSTSTVLETGWLVYVSWYILRHMSHVMQHGYRDFQGIDREVSLASYIVPEKNHNTKLRSKLNPGQLLMPYYIHWLLWILSSK